MELEIRRFIAIRDHHDNVIAAQNRIRSARFASDKRREFATLLKSTRSFFAQVEQWSKGDGRANGWWHRVRGEIKKDPLLKYLMQARDIVAHVGEVPVECSFKIDAKTQPANLYSRSKYAAELEIDLTAPSVIEHEEIITRFFNPRANRRVELPESHLGTKLASLQLEEIGALAANYVHDVMTVVTDFMDSQAEAAK